MYFYSILITSLGEGASYIASGWILVMYLMRSLISMINAPPKKNDVQKKSSQVRHTNLQGAICTAKMKAINNSFNLSRLR